MRAKFGILNCLGAITIFFATLLVCPRSVFAQDGCDIACQGVADGCGLGIDFLIEVRTGHASIAFVKIVFGYVVEKLCGLSCARIVAANCGAGVSCNSERLCGFVENVCEGVITAIDIASLADIPLEIIKKVPEWMAEELCGRGCHEICEILHLGVPDPPDLCSGAEPGDRQCGINGRPCAFFDSDCCQSASCNMGSWCRVAANLRGYGVCLPCDGCSSIVCNSYSECATFCSNGIRDRGETGVDCGGPCRPCLQDGGSDVVTDTLVPLPTCYDGIRNQDELGVDCGGRCSTLSGRCPSCNGSYCGDPRRDSRQSSAYLYECRNGVYSLLSTCAGNGCQGNLPGTSDRCSSGDAGFIDVNSLDSADAADAGNSSRDTSLSTDSFLDIGSDAADACIPCRLGEVVCSPDGRVRRLCVQSTSSPCPYWEELVCSPVDGSVCIAGSGCVVCGTRGQPCCPTALPCRDASACIGGTCTIPPPGCGNGICDRTSGENCATCLLDCPCPATGTVCTATGMCATCGGRDQPCCGSRVCQSPPASLYSSANCGSDSICHWSCLANREDCDGSIANGCEADLTSPRTCGNCLTNCPLTRPSCMREGAAYACGSGCPVSTQTLCGTSCSDVRVDVANCGSCGNICPSGADCQNGTCLCPAGQSICGNRCVSLQASNNNCGACGAVCSPGQVCLSGSCRCPVGTVLCAGACLVESDMRCGSSCQDCTSSGRMCTAGSCSCPAGTVSCDGSCTDALSNSRNCGMCGAACTAPSGATPTCSGGMCGFLCNTGTHNCGGICVSNGSPQNCGSNSCSPCFPPANATSTCNGLSCDFLCNAGYSRAGGNCVAIMDGGSGSSDASSADVIPADAIPGTRYIFLDSSISCDDRRPIAVTDVFGYTWYRFCYETTDPRPASVDMAQFCDYSGADLPDYLLPRVNVPTGSGPYTVDVLMRISNSQEFCPNARLNGSYPYIVGLSGGARVDTGRTFLYRIVGGAQTVLTLQAIPNGPCSGLNYHGVGTRCPSSSPCALAGDYPCF